MTDPKQSAKTIRHSASRLVPALLASTALIGAAMPAFAANWTPAATLDWLDAANWSTNMVPDAAEAVIVDGGANPANLIGVGSGGVAAIVHVGYLGSGTLTILDGATLDASGLDLGFDATAFGQMTIDGIGSDLDYGNNLYVGYNGIGLLTLSGGAHMHGAGAGIGDAASGTGIVNVDGAGSLWSMDFNLGVATNNIGTLNISNGGQVTSQTGSIAYAIGSLGGVTIDGANSSWDMTGALDIGNGGNGVVTLSNGGSISASDIQVATTVDGLGTFIIGSAPASPAVAAGTINAPTITFGSGSGAIVFNHTDTNYQFAPDLVGFGFINHNSGHTILTGDSSAFTGLADVHGGTLSVNNAFGGAVDVSADGTLGGTGTINDFAAHAGGKVAPGNSIGTLHSTNAGFYAGSLFEVEVDAAGHSDALDVADTLGIDNGSTVSVLAQPGVYAANTQYTLATAGTMVDGTFDSVTSNLAFLTPTLSYDLHHVYLTLALNGTSMVDVAVTPNQIAAATGADGLGAGNPIYDGLISLTTPQAIAAFDALSGEVHASFKGALLDDSRLVRDLVLGRAGQDLQDPSSDELAVNAYAAPVTSAAVAATDFSSRDNPGHGPWASAYGALGSIDGDGNAASASSSTGGFVIGADGAVSGWDVGLLANLGLSAMDDPARASSASSTDYGVGVYADTDFDGTGLTFGATYTRHAVETNRHVAFPGFDETLSSDYGAGTAQAFVELSRKLQLDAVTFEPFANLTYVNHATEGFTETGGAAALSSAADTLDATFTMLGLRASTTFNAGALPVTATGSLAWRHTFGGEPSASNSFAGGSPFTVLGVPATSDAALVDAGFSAAVNSTSKLALSYSGELSASQQSHAIKIGFDGRF